MFAIEDESSRRCRNDEQLSAHPNKHIHLYFRRLPNRAGSAFDICSVDNRNLRYVRMSASTMVNIMEMELAVVTISPEDGSDMSFGTSGDDDLESRGLWDLLCKEEQNRGCILLLTFI